MLHLNSLASALLVGALLSGNGTQAQTPTATPPGVVEACRHASGIAVGPPDYDGYRAAGVLEPVADQAFFFVHVAPDTALGIGAIAEDGAQPVLALASRDGRAFGAGSGLVTVPPQQQTTEICIHVATGRPEIVPVAIVIGPDVRDVSAERWLHLMPIEAGLRPFPPVSDLVVRDLSPAGAPVSIPARLDGPVWREWIEVTVPTRLSYRVDVDDPLNTVVTRLFEEAGGLIVEWQFIGGLDRGPVDAVLRPGRYMLVMHGLNHVPMEDPVNLVMTTSPP